MRAKVLGHAAVQLSALALAVFGLTHLCVELPRAAGRFAPVWLPNAVVLAWLLRTPFRNGWSLVLAGVVGGFVAQLGLWHDSWIAFGATLSNTIEIVACWLALHRLRPQGLDPADPGSLRVMTLVSAAGSALCVLSATVLLGGRFPGGSPISILSWWAADALGLVIFVPCLLVLTRARHYARDVKLRPRGVAALLMLTGALLIAFGQTRYPLTFLIPPLFMLVSLELELIGAAVAVLLFAIVTIGASFMRLGPDNFITAEAGGKLALMQLFVAVSGLSALGLAAMRVQQRRLREALIAATDEARENAERSLAAQEVAGVVHWRLNLADEAITWSPGMYALFGLDPSEPISSERVGASIHPDDRDTLFGQIASLKQGGTPDELALIRVIRPDGEMRYARGRTIKERDPDGAVFALFGTLLDVTEHRLAAMAVAESEARFRTLAENTNDAIIRMNNRGECVYVSPALERITGLTPEEMIGRDPMGEVHPEDAEAFAGFLEKLVAGQLPPGGRTRHRRLHKDGHYVWLEGFPTAVFDEHGALIEVIDVVRDVTTQQALEDELKAAREAAEAASTVKSQFLSNMSHELRTPLTAVLGFSSLLSREPDLNPKALDYVRRLDTAGMALLAIINDVLDFSKLEAGGLQLVARPISPADLVRDTVELFTLNAEGKGVGLTTTGLDGLPPSVITDPDRLRQVLLNLIGNAVKFTDEGAVAVRARHDGVRLEVTVEDTGPGIARGQRSRLFQRFSQIDGSSTRRHGGSGLGLAICKGLVDAMGGEIGFRSRRSGGSSFWFAIPAPAAAEAVADRRPADDTATWRGGRVLVVDDHPVNRQLARAILEPLGLEIEEAADGRSAIAAALDRPFDVILLDLRMPDIDGVSAMRSIRRRKGFNRSTPILAFSAEGGDEALPHGFDGRVAKPLTATALMSAVMRFAAPSPGQDAADAA